MPSLSIRLKKHPDGSASLACTRPSGSVTWQQQSGPRARFFPPHDLTHFAVETVLGVRRGFYGLIAEGWDITDFTAPWPRGPLPPEAAEVEVIVGALDMERLQGELLTAHALAEHRTLQGESRRAHGKGTTPITYVLTDNQLVAIRARRDELLAQWQALPAGETMELAFD
jgi:hypothetical protein